MSHTVSKPKLCWLFFKALCSLFPVVVTASIVGVFFAHLADIGYAWLPALAVSLAVPAVYWNQKWSMNAAEGTALAQWERVEAPWISDLASRHGVRVDAVVSVPATGAFWIHAGSAPDGTPRGIIGLGEHLDDAHLETTLSHEFGHGALQHLPKRATAAAQATTPALLPALFAPFGPVAAASLAVLSAVFGVLWFSAFCRRQELEADLFASRHSGVTPTLGMLESLAPYANAADLLALHPPIAARRTAVIRAV